MDDSQPLLEEDGDEDSATPKGTTSRFGDFSLRSVITYLINLGSGIGNLLLYYISGIFRPRTEPTNTHNNNIN